VGVVVMALTDGETVGKEDMLTDGVALIDTMLADTDGETEVAGVIDEVGEVDTRLGEGELVTAVELLGDSVALAVTVVPDGEALGDSGLADNAAAPLALTVVYGEVGCEGVT
jgi:hypothetical protein